MPLSERNAPVPGALSVPCPACKAPAGKPCSTAISGYPMPHSTHDLRARDVARERARVAEAALLSESRWHEEASARARAAEAAHLQMVRKAGELRDERDRLREALDAIGSLGGPLHMLEPDQGDGPPNYEWAATELRRILNTVTAVCSAGADRTEPNNNPEGDAA